MCMQMQKEQGDSKSLLKSCSKFGSDSKELQVVREETATDLPVYIVVVVLFDVCLLRPASKLTNAAMYIIYFLCRIYMQWCVLFLASLTSITSTFFVRISMQESIDHKIYASQASIRCSNLFADAQQTDSMKSPCAVDGCCDKRCTQHTILTITLIHL